MKLEVGMYVRTKNGYIRKIDRIWNDTNFNVDKVYYNENIYENTLGCVLDEDIKGNPSFNIIDLIEAKDLMYIDISPDDCGGIVVPRIAETLYELEEWKEKFSNGSCILKRVVTHEQIESMSYKVGE